MQGATGDEAMKPYRRRRSAKRSAHLQQATMWFMQNAHRRSPTMPAPARTDYMHLFGLVALGYMWAQMAKAAQAKLAAGANGADDRHEGQARHRPLLHGAHAAGDAPRISRASRPAPTRMMALPAEAF